MLIDNIVEKVLEEEERKKSKENFNIEFKDELEIIETKGDEEYEF